jgi:hypothetical protein
MAVNEWGQKLSKNDEKITLKSQERNIGPVKNPFQQDAHSVTIARWINPVS